jgi:membrane-associated phospholipid phosphatase
MRGDTVGATSWMLCAALLGLGAGSNLARAETAAVGQPTPTRPVRRHAPLRENFPWLEIGGIATLAGANVVLKLYEYDLAKARGAPLIGAPPAFDRWISDRLYPGPFASPFLLTEVGPVVYLSYRGIDTLALWLRGRALTPALNPDHKLFAFGEAYLLTTVVTLIAKEAIGRVRPFEELHRYGSDPGQPKTTLSFWSNQTAAAFCFATFGFRDLTDWLTSGPLAGKGRVTRVGLGRVLPAVLIFGAAAFDGYSRIVDQRHWFSDTVVGALVGGGIGYGVYSYHFDGEGQPRSRAASNTTLTILPAPGGVALVGRF